MAKKKGNKYEAIIEAAVKVIAHHGFHQAQVSKIAKEAKVADGTIYLYFKNKEDLLISLFAKKMGQFVTVAGDRIGQETSASAQLKMLVYMHLYQLSIDPNLAVVTQLELRQSNPQLRKEINGILKEYLTLIDQVIQTGVEQQVFHTGLDLLVARYMIFGTLDESVTNWLLKDRKYDLLSLVDPIHHLLLNGLKR